MVAEDTVKRCSVCINDERIVPVLEVDGRLLCRDCVKQLPHIPDRKQVREELDRIMENVDRAVLAFSGGKDSVVAMYLAREVHGVELEAVMWTTGSWRGRRWRTPGEWRSTSASPSR